MIQFAVLGKAQPAGSKKVVTSKRQGRAIIVDANKHSKKWKESVSGVAFAEMNGRAPLDCPISLGLLFLIERPAGHYLTNGIDLSAAGRRFICHTQKPDVLKLARGVEDALTGVVYVDDAQIVEEAIGKRWCLPNERSQVVITVKPFADNLIARLLEGGHA